MGHCAIHTAKPQTLCPRTSNLFRGAHVPTHFNWFFFKTCTKRWLKFSSFQRHPVRNSGARRKTSCQVYSGKRVCNGGHATHKPYTKKDRGDFSISWKKYKFSKIENCFQKDWVEILPFKDVAMHVPFGKVKHLFTQSDRMMQGWKRSLFSWVCSNVLHNCPKSLLIILSLLSIPAVGRNALAKFYILYSDSIFPYRCSPLPSRTLSA